MDACPEMQGNAGMGEGLSLRGLDLGSFVVEAALTMLEGCGLGRVDEGQSLQRRE